MKILFYTAHFWPYIAGGQVIAAHFVQGLQQRGYDVIVVTSHDQLDLPDYELFHGIPVYRFPFWPAAQGRNAQLIFELREKLYQLKKTFAPDLVHMSSISPIDLFHWHTRHAAPVPTVLTMQGQIPITSNFDHSVAHQTLNAADWVIACSAATLANAIKLVPDIQSRASVIYNGLNPPKVTPNSLPLHPPHLLCIGRLEHQKGFDLAITAFRDILLTFANCKLTIIGDGSQRNTLMAQAQNLGIQHQIDFRGWVSPDLIPEVINTATLVLMPSRWEPFGLVALEAALMARPVIAAAVEGLPEVILDGKTGRLVPPEDPLALANAVKQLLQHPEQMQSLGEAARHRAIHQFGLDHHVESYGIVYNQLVNPR